jgi:hypothetical protein
MPYETDRVVFGEVRWQKWEHEFRETGDEKVAY